MGSSPTSLHALGVVRGARNPTRSPLQEQPRSISPFVPAERAAGRDQAVPQRRPQPALLHQRGRGGPGHPQVQHRGALRADDQRDRYGAGSTQAPSSPPAWSLLGCPKATWGGTWGPPLHPVHPLAAPWGRARPQAEPCRGAVAREERAVPHRTCSTRGSAAALPC